VCWCVVYCDRVSAFVVLFVNVRQSQPFILH